MPKQKRFEPTCILVVGGLTFCGFNFMQWMHKHQKNVKLVCVDAMVEDDPFLEMKLGWIEKTKVPFYKYRPGDDKISIAADLESIDCIINFVNDAISFNSNLHKNSMLDYAVFMQITCNLLQVAMRRNARYHQVGTLYRYGVQGSTDMQIVNESAGFDLFDMMVTAKEAADLLVQTFGVNPHHDIIATVSRSSMLFGPWQMNNIVPNFIFRIFAGIDVDKEKIELYDAVNVYTYVDHHSDSLWKILQYGKTGDSYDITGYTTMMKDDLDKFGIKVEEGGGLMSEKTMFKTLAAGAGVDVDKLKIRIRKDKI